MTSSATRYAKDPHAQGERSRAAAALRRSAAAGRMRRADNTTNSIRHCCNNNNNYIPSLLYRWSAQLMPS